MKIQIMYKIFSKILLTWIKITYKLTKIILKNNNKDKKKNNNNDIIFKKY